jgi:hypothetical protein
MTSPARMKFAGARGVRQEMVERVLGRHGPGAVLRRQDLDQRLIEPKLPAVDEPEGRRRGDHLRDRSHPEACLIRDRDAVAPMGDTPGVLKHGGASAPDQGDTAELVGPDSFVEPHPKGIGAHRPSVGQLLLHLGVRTQRVSPRDQGVSCDRAIATVRARKSA